MGDSNYRVSMTERSPRYLTRAPHVTIEAAAELCGVDTETVRGWAEAGALQVERRGDMEVVQLEHVRALASRHRRKGRDNLRNRLKGGTPPTERPISIVDLQEVARERAD
jgi:hypothetical protein